VKKEEEEDATLASKRQQGRKKRDPSKIKCFQCGEPGHFPAIVLRRIRTRKLLPPKFLWRTMLRR